MAKAKAVFQPILGDTFHCQQLEEMLAGGDAETVLISSAFVNGAGVRMIMNALAPHVQVSRAFIGIRNGVTTLQGVRALLDSGVAVHVIDTGTQHRIFHPKFFLVRRAGSAEALIGSANLTYGGLGSNIEASVRLDLDLADASDEAVINDLTEPLDRMLVDIPSNCYRIDDLAKAQELFDAGLLEDEAVPKIATPIGVVTGAVGPGVAVPKMNLPTLPRPPRPAPVAVVPVPVAPVPAQPVAVLVTSPAVYGPVVWVKRDLPASDLQFPGPNGNPTGVLRLTQAGYPNDGIVIDQTSYFRNVVFGLLTWTQMGTKEEASANFTLVIGGVVIGTFSLDLSHKAAWEARQGNYTTAIHWGPTIPYIRHQALIGRDLTLRAPSVPAGPYVIEID